MSKVKDFLNELALPFSEVGENTFVVQPRTAINTRIGISVEDEIVTFTTNVVSLGEDMKNFTKLDTHQLLWWNATQMLHAAYGISGENVVLTGALEFENLDLNEFQGMIDDISMGVDQHFATVRSWVGLTTEKEAA